AEFMLVPVAEFGLGKRRILELYLNVVEWGLGIYGIEAASGYYYATRDRELGRHQAARLAAILPAHAETPSATNEGVQRSDPRTYASNGLVTPDRPNRSPVSYGPPTRRNQGSRKSRVAPTSAQAVCRGQASIAHRVPRRRVPAPPPKQIDLCAV